MTRIDRRHFLALAGATWLGGAGAADEAHDERWTDARRGREIPLRIRVPDGTRPCAGVLYSHGLGGSREGGDAWGRAWRDAGFLVIHLQHPGSDTEALRGGPGALKRAIDPQQLLDRIADVRFALDELARRRDEAPWSRLRLDAIGMAGHSFGAVTTMALAGQRFPAPAPDVSDPRLRAFVALSPSPGRRGGQSPQAQFGQIRRPMLCLTGTLDGDPLGSAEVTPATRRQVYDGLPPGQRALLVLDQADHMTFGGNAAQRIRRAGLAGRRDPATMALEPAHHATVAAISTDWWRAELLGERDADDRLRAPAGLAAADHWQRD